MLTYRQYWRVAHFIPSDPFFGRETEQAKLKDGGKLKKVKCSPKIMRFIEELRKQGVNLNTVKKAEIHTAAKRLMAREGVAPMYPQFWIAETPISAEDEKKAHASSMQAARGEAQLGLAPEQAAPVEVEVVRVSRAIVLPESFEDFTVQIKLYVHGHHQKFLEGIIAIGATIVGAMEKYGQELKDIAARSDLSYNMLTQYVKIAQFYAPYLQSWARAQLPASVDSLVRLSRLTPEQLEDAINQGKVKDDMGRQEVKALLREYRPATLRSCRSKAKIERTPATLESVRAELIRLQEMVEAYRSRMMDSQDLIPLLKGHVAWCRVVLKDQPDGKAL